MAGKMRRIGKALGKPFMAAARGIAKGARVVSGRELTARQRALAYASKSTRKGRGIQIPTGHYGDGTIRTYRTEYSGKEIEHGLTGRGGFQLEKHKYETVVEHREGDGAWGVHPRDEVASLKKYPIWTREYDGKGKLIRQVKHTKKGDKVWEYSPAGKFKGKRVRSLTK